MSAKPVSIFWFRRDLRLDDNAGLYHALKSELPVLPIFIFDSNILSQLKFKNDARVTFIYNEIKKLKQQLIELGSDLLVFYGDPAKEIWPQIINDYRVNSIYLNHDYEPSAIKRDQLVEKLAKNNEIKYYTYKDQVIFDKNEIVKEDGNPYTVFTPYSKKWKNSLNHFHLKSYPNSNYFEKFLKIKKPQKLISLADFGFSESGIQIPSSKLNIDIITSYHVNRDNLALESGTTKLGIHLRFGTISVRRLADLALNYNETYLNELIWREFYSQILWHFPHVVSQSFKPKYNSIKWRNNKTEFQKWCNGMTGFPIVDAAMRQLNDTGYMHNRARMIAASFLVKDLLIDWRWGEKYFAQRLLDFELASNNGGWQWSAGTGCDAAPYFRIFNPDSQQKKFDPNFEYVRRWIPEFGTSSYPEQIVDHKEARIRTLAAYKLLDT